MNKKFVSDCHGDEINYAFYSMDTYGNEEKKLSYCLKCHRLCQSKEIEGKKS